MKTYFASLILATLCLVLAAPKPAPAADKVDPKDHAIKLADGKLTLTAPDGWIRTEPKNRIVEIEFAVPGAMASNGPGEGRVTVMGAGGGVEANIERLVSQFSVPQGEALKPKTDKKTIAGQEVHLLDIAGTYHEPFARPAGAAAVERPDYRMLAAVIVSKDGNYFIKFYGPKATVDASEKGFDKMIDGLQAK